MKLKNQTELLQMYYEKNIKIAELEKSSKLKKQQLTRAKDLLNEFMRISKVIDEDFGHDYTELIAEAEQFISKVEK